MMFSSCSWPSCPSTLPPWSLPLTRGTASGEMRSQSILHPSHISLYFISSLRDRVCRHDTTMNYSGRLQIGISLIFPFLFIFWTRGIKRTPWESSLWNIDGFDGVISFFEASRLAINNWYVFEEHQNSGLRNAKSKVFVICILQCFTSCFLFHHVSIICRSKWTKTVFEVLTLCSKKLISS